MRRSVLSAVLAAALSVVACSDQTTEPRVTEPGPSEPPPSLLEAPLGCVPAPTAASLLTQVNELLPRSPLRTTLITLIGGLPQRFQDRIKAAVRSRIFLIQDLILKAFYAGRLTGGTSTDTYDKVLRLIEALHCYVGSTPPTFPSTTDGEQITIRTFFPGQTGTLQAAEAEDGTVNAAVTITDPNTITPEMGPVTITIRKLPDSPGPLRTSLDQYPFFYHFSGTTATGPVTFNRDVIAGICLKEDTEVLGVDPANLRLAHNVAPLEFGDVEILPLFVGQVPGLECEPELGLLRSSSRSGVGVEGGDAWNSIRSAIAPLARALLPEPLHATSTTLFTVGVGGTKNKFSDFGIVDILSNPGAFSPDGPTNTTEEAGSTVSRTVLVTSDNGTPINRAPVTFTTADGTLVGGSPQTVLTDQNGNASVSWTLPPEPGEHTLTADVPEEDNPPQETTDPPANNVGSTPDVAFDPTLLTFTATVPSPVELSILSGNEQAGFANQILTAPLVVSATQDGVGLAGTVVNFAVTSGGGTITSSATTNALGRAEAIWTLGPTVGSQSATAVTAGTLPVTFSATAAAPPVARIVLQWGATLSDLDSHLSGPNPPPSETRFHVYYASRGSLTTSPFAALDRDDTDAFGPETTTITELADGTYRFSVHNFSNRLSNPSSALAGSGATVTVYLASGTTEVYSVPNQPGTLWTVFTLSGETITPVNTMSYESDPASTTAFSVFGRAAAAMQSDAVVIRDAITRHAK